MEEEQKGTESKLTTISLKRLASLTGRETPIVADDEENSQGLRVWKKRSEGREKVDEEWWRLLSAVSASSTLMRVTSKGKAREFEVCARARGNAATSGLFGLLAHVVQSNSVQTCLWRRINMHLTLDRRLKEILVKKRD